MSDDQKLCVICGDTYVGKPRIKNDKGQYAHQSCVKEKQSKSAEPVAALDDELLGDDLYDDALGGGMDDLLGDLDAHESFGEDSSSASACPGCGQRMNADTVVCMSCGFNTQSGKAMKTHSKDAGKPSGAGKAMSGVAKAGGFAMGPFLPLIGACIGGLIGAIIWAAIAYFFGIEFGWIAWIVGGLVGFGATLSSDDSAGGAVTGAMAAIVAMCSIAGGKYMAIHFAAQSYMGSEEPALMTASEVEEVSVLYRIANLEAESMIANGSVFEWEDSAYIEIALWPDDYPSDIQSETERTWSTMSTADQRSHRQKIANNENAESDDYDYEWTVADIDDVWALNSLANQICEKRVRDDVEIAWPDPNLPMGWDGWPEGFPESVQVSAQARWDGMSVDEQYEMKDEIAQEINSFQESLTDFQTGLTNKYFMNSFAHPVNIVFMFLAVITAYGIAANES